MYIARLQLKGFKSFGGSHDLPLGPGMTAIVGPNGSGKSNLLDALRWVLGDSHASKLRVTKQGGLIFHGSASRPQATEGEVAIQMREGTRVCTIRRRVSEAGAVVTVDGSRVTLAELDEVKRLWQLAGDKFAFIGQGDVAEVIQQRPSARRMLLESLFGIDVYRKRRTDAADRLAEAREEYDRLRTFSAELSSRRAEIAPQVERAEAARAVLDALEEERRLLYWVRRARNECALREVDIEKKRIASLVQRKEIWRYRWERALAFLEGNISELSQTRQNQIRELDEAKSALSNFTRTAYTYGSTLSNARRRATQIASDREELQAKIEALRADRDRSADESRSLERELGAARTSLADAEGRYAATLAAIEDARAARETRNRMLGEVDGEIAALKGRMKSIAATVRALEEQSEKKNQPGRDDPVRAIKKEMDALEKRHAALLEEQENVASRHRDVYAKLQSVSADLQKNRRESSRLSSRLSEVQEQAAAEMYPRPVQHVLSASRLGRTKVKPVAVIDAFSCDGELASAMEAFLGGRQFWLLVETMDEAGECIDLLKKNQMGRATFLPLERSRPRTPDYSHKLPTEGIVGWAMELVKPEKHWRPALEHLMGDLLIVESYEVGQRLVRGGFRGPIATLDGDVFQPGGSISGGRAQKSGKAIEIKSALSKLEAEARAARSLVDSLSVEFARPEEEELAAAGRKETVSAEIRELSSKRSELDARREEILRERARMKTERDAMTASLKEGAAAYAALARKKRELAETESGADAADLDAELFREVERLKSAVALMEEKQRSGFVLSERVIAELRSLEKNLADFDEEMSSCEQEIITNRANLVRLGRRYAEVASRRRVVAAEMAEFSDRYELISHRRDRREARMEAAKAASHEAAERARTFDLRAAELAREHDELVQTWEEQYPYPGEDAFEGAAKDTDPDALRRSIRERDRQLKSLGEVDMGVLSEDRNLRDRLAFLGEQLDDVRGGMIELERLIADADEQARTVFTGALEEIDKKFNDLFQRLFTGGDARLEMIEGDSLWESGVDVVARPPGKHPQSIAQLSGGEQSLSAIALLFASLEVAQCPIAVLDEVDAALDEVNLRRFADLAKDASRERQIFVMTHRRVTMERADVLYGVTLAEPGLSQVIGVRVEDWA
ncbi:chromosome segregation protein SMC [Synergistaceae bacterium OttesenSCG-928-I11]|nr:chromosome segregation protein SMC [Synergistaceae bacterium OttesenSCG-928-I11]